MSEIEIQVDTDWLTLETVSMKSILAPLSLVFLLSFSSLDRAQAVGKEMMTSATYGVLAGTIVGAATLAFAENPGDKIHRVARGASLGLYAGLLLGFYVTYGLSSGAPDEYYEEEFIDGVQYRRMKPPRLALVPVMGESGLEGAAALWRVKSY